jgi:hypothetical protein
MGLATVKSKCQNCRLVQSGILQHRDVSWWHIGAVSDRIDWILKALGICCIDPNRWMEEGDFVEIGCI